MIYRGSSPEYKTQIGSANAVNYYFCDVCHYCFETESLPDRCPDCGKVKFQDRAAVRSATDKEIKDLLRARAEDED